MKQSWTTKISDLGPDYAVHRLVWRGADGANRVNLLRGFWLALVASSLSLGNDKALTVKARGPRLDQNFARGETEAVHVASRIDIIECVHDHGKLHQKKIDNENALASI